MKQSGLWVKLRMVMSHSMKRVPFGYATFDVMHKAQNNCQSVFPKLKAINSSVLVNMIYEKILFLKINILFLITLTCGKDSD